MATPRIFVSSTCYDLQEVRGQLRGFIELFGYLPVMSEYGDIFYDYQKHIQDACKEEIGKCQLFILIIGNSYGSIYHSRKNTNKIPDSVTLQEVKKALELDVYKHIFVNKFVDYDYKNYKRALDTYITDYFEVNEYQKENVDEKLIELRTAFNKIYSFPQANYNYIFNFLDILYDLKSNNAIITYETFDDIKESLKKQWAGFVYDSIVRSRTVSVDLIAPLSEKIDRVESQIKLLVENQVSNGTHGNQVTFDITKLANQVVSSDFKTLRENLNESLALLLHPNHLNFSKRIILKQHLTTEKFNDWFNTLEKKLSIYKWSQDIKVTNLFKGLGVNFSYFPNFENIPYDPVANFFNIVSSIKQEPSGVEYNSLVNHIVNSFNELYEDDKVSEPIDDLPF